MKLFIFFLYFNFLAAQNDSLRKWQLDSLRLKFQKDSAHTYRPKKFRPMIGYDSRNSFIRDAPVNFLGLQLGLSYKDKHTFGFGAYKITQNSSRPTRRRDANKTVIQHLTLNYITTFYQYTLIDKRFFEIDLPLEFGLGKATIRINDDLTGLQISNRSTIIFPVGLGLQGIVKPVRWVGLTLMGGYRYVGENQKNLNFNGWYYSVGVWLEFRRIVRDVKFYGFQRKKYRRERAQILK